MASSTAVATARHITQREVAPTKSPSLPKATIGTVENNKMDSLQ